MATIPQQAPKAWEKFPTWVTDLEGNRRVARDPAEYERMTGIRVDLMGKPVVESEPEPEPKPVPPTIEQVLQAGYSEAVAKRIVEQEQRKHAAGEYPYGQNSRLESSKPAEEPKELPAEEGWS